MSQKKGTWNDWKDGGRCCHRTQHQSMESRAAVHWQVNAGVISKQAATAAVRLKSFPGVSVQKGELVRRQGRRRCSASEEGRECMVLGVKGQQDLLDFGFRRWLW